MMQIVKDAWNKYGNCVSKRFANTKREELYSYKTILKIAIEEILDREETYPCDQLDIDRIHEIDDGDYQGTLMYIIPQKGYQPSERDYFVTYVDYGSCCCCDTLQHILDGICDCNDEYPNDEAVKELVILAKDMLTNMVKPYNIGWRSNKKYDQVEEKENKNYEK